MVEDQFDKEFLIIDKILYFIVLHSFINVIH